ncbi:MAG: tetratricopeptide repeat protein [Polyangiaceae bacterium]
MNRDVSVERALHLFDEALARAPDHAWARLYRAHCLYDLERWTEAADAYAAVPKGAFDGPRSWRMHLLVEQRALCLLRGGRREEALALFSKILGRYEAQPHLARWGDLRYADQAVDDLPELKEPLARAREALARTELGR